MCFADGMRTIFPPNCPQSASANEMAHFVWLSQATADVASHIPCGGLTLVVEKIRTDGGIRGCQKLSMTLIW